MRNEHDWRPGARDLVRVAARVLISLLLVAANIALPTADRVVAIERLAGGSTPAGPFELSTQAFESCDSGGCAIAEEDDDRQALVAAAPDVVTVTTIVASPSTSTFTDVQYGATQTTTITPITNTVTSVSVETFTLTASVPFTAVGETVTRVVTATELGNTTVTFTPTVTTATVVTAATTSFVTTTSLATDVVVVSTTSLPSVTASVTTLTATVTETPTLVASTSSPTLVTFTQTLVTGTVNNTNVVLTVTTTVSTFPTLATLSSTTVTFTNVQSTTTTRFTSTAVSFAATLTSTTTLTAHTTVYETVTETSTFTRTTYVLAALAPTAIGVTTTVVEDQPRNVTLAGQDLQSSVSFELVSGPSHGTLGAIVPVGCGGIEPVLCTARIRYSPVANFVGGDNFTYRAFDGANYSNIATVDLTVVPGNDAPVISVPLSSPGGRIQVPRNGQRVFSAANGNPITIADPDAGNAPIRVTLQAGSGRVTLSATAGLTLGAGQDGTDDAVIQMTGSIAAINAALDGLIFRAQTNYAGPASLVVTANDLGNSPPPARQSQATIYLQIVP